jgi:hypothetical protein
MNSRGMMSSPQPQYLNLKRGLMQITIGIALRIKRALALLERERGRVSVCVGSWHINSTLLIHAHFPSRAVTLLIDLGPVRQPLLDLRAPELDIFSFHRSKSKSNLLSLVLVARVRKACVIDSQQLAASAARGAARRAARALPAARWLRRSLHQPPAFATARQMVSVWRSANLFFTHDCRECIAGIRGGFSASAGRNRVHTYTANLLPRLFLTPRLTQGGISLMLCQERDGGCSYCTPSPLWNYIK